jgi:hypothetical protein
VTEDEFGKVFLQVQGRLEGALGSVPGVGNCPKPCHIEMSVSQQANATLFEEGGEGEEAIA